MSRRLLIFLLDSSLPSRLDARCKDSRLKRLSASWQRNNLCVPALQLCVVAASSSRLHVVKTLCGSVLAAIMRSSSPPARKLSAACRPTRARTKSIFQTERRSYYVREELGWGPKTSMPHLNPVDNDKAQTEIQSCVQQPEMPRLLRRRRLGALDSAPGRRRHSGPRGSSLR